MLALVKAAIKPFVPKPILSAGSTARSYGAVLNTPTFSGDGSIPEVVEPYVSSVRTFLSQRPPSDVVEIGCGDFAVASRLIDLARTYTACDVVPELIERNRRMFVRDNLTFRAIDAVTDPLPPGDLVIVRQLFQHLRKDQIQAILRKFARYRTWIISQHVPSSSFVPNLDILSGPDRLSVGSGVVITQAPFWVRPRHSQVLSEVHVKGGVIRAQTYSF